MTYNLFFCLRNNGIDFQIIFHYFLGKKMLSYVLSEFTFSLIIYRMFRQIVHFFIYLKFYSAHPQCPSSASSETQKTNLITSKYLQLLTQNVHITETISPRELPPECHTFN